MREAAAIVQPAIDINAITRSVQAAYTQLLDADRLVETTSKKHESALQAQRLIGFRFGKESILAKEQCAHGEWMPLLAKLGIEQRKSNYWMKYARECQARKIEPNQDGSNLPSQRDLGIRGQADSDKSATESVEDGDSPEIRDGNEEESFHVLVEPAKFKHWIRKRAERWPDEARNLVPSVLRDLADELEGEWLC